MPAIVQALFFVRIALTLSKVLHETQKIHCISGLGADERIFAHVKVEGTELVHLPWPQQDEHDDMAAYAKKVSAMIPEENPVLLGVSFGGMLAVEIAKQRSVRKAIIVSSAKTGSEVTHFTGLNKWIVKHKMVPAFMFTWPHPYVLYLFGAATDEEKELMRGIIKSSDGKLVRWALKAIQEWHNEMATTNVVHIHGDADKIIESKCVRADYWIKGGTHIMLYNRADEINEIIKKELAG